MYEERGEEDRPLGVLPRQDQVTDPFVPGSVDTRVWTTGHDSPCWGPMVGTLKVGRARLERFASSLAFCIAQRFYHLALIFLARVVTPSRLVRLFRSGKPSRRLRHGATDDVPLRRSGSGRADRTRGPESPGGSTMGIHRSHDEDGRGRSSPSSDAPDA